MQKRTAHHAGPHQVLMPLFKLLSVCFERYRSAPCGGTLMALRCSQQLPRRQQPSALASAARRLPAKVAVVKAHAADPQSRPKAAKSAPNPLLSTRALTLTRVNGTRVLVNDIVKGKLVMGVLRHLGCPLCWEQARNLLSLQPLLEQSGFSLMLISAGTPQGARQFCEALPCPPQLLYLDAPDTRPLYKALALKSGFWTLMGNDTRHASLNALKSKDLLDLKDVLSHYKAILPDNLDTTTQMGGLYVFDGPHVLYAYQDPGVGAHAPNWELLTACCCPVTAGNEAPPWPERPRPAANNALALTLRETTAVSVVQQPGSTALSRMPDRGPTSVATTTARQTIAVVISSAARPAAVTPVVIPASVIEDEQQGYVVNMEEPEMPWVAVEEPATQQAD